MQKIADKAVDRLAECAAELNDLHAEGQKILVDAQAALAEIIAKAEEIREEAFAILDEARNDAEAFFEEKSDRWQEGERGQLYSEWKDRLAEVADQVGEPFEEPDFPEFEAPDWIGELENAGDFATPNY